MHFIKLKSYIYEDTVKQCLPENVIAISAFIVMISALFLLPEISEAATTVGSNAVKGEKQIGQALTNIKGLVEGTIGKVIAIVSFAFGLMASVFKFNPAAIGGSFGVALTASLGPSAIDTIVGATF